MLLRCVKALQYTQSCVGPALCAWLYRPPAAPLHPWEWPSEPWSRIHLDFACPYMGSMFLVLVNAHSKWMDAHLMHSITSAKTIEKLCIIFANHRIARKVVTDNGPTFTSYEFQEFMQKNEIVQVKSAPYHFSSNGLAERAVQTLKRGIAQTSGTTLQERVSKPCTRHRAVQTLHYAQGCKGPALYAGLYRPCTIRRALQALHSMQGCAVPTLYTSLNRPCTIHRAVQAQHDAQGCTGLAVYAGLCRPCTVRKAFQPSIIIRAVQAQHNTQGCTGPAVYTGLWRPCTIYAGLYRPCTTHTIWCIDQVCTCLEYAFTKGDQVQTVHRIASVQYIYEMITDLRRRKQK